MREEWWMEWSCRWPIKQTNIKNFEAGTENCITFNFLEGLEGNVKEIVDGSAFKLYWKVCTKNGDWNEVAEVKMDWVSSFQPLLSVWKMWNESLGRNSLLSSKFEDDQAKQSWYAWAFDIHKGAKSFMKSPQIKGYPWMNCIIVHKRFHVI